MVSKPQKWIQDCATHSNLTSPVLPPKVASTRLHVKTLLSYLVAISLLFSFWHTSFHRYLLETAALNLHHIHLNIRDMPVSTATGLQTKLSKYHGSIYSSDTIFSHLRTYYTFPRARGNPFFHSKAVGKWNYSFTSTKWRDEKYVKASLHCHTCF
jgi:hypothetical protein